MNLIKTRWPRENIEFAVAVLGQHERLHDALVALTGSLGFEVTRSGLDCALKRAGLGTAASYLRGSIPPVHQRDTEVSLPVAPAVDLPDDSWTTAPQALPVPTPPTSTKRHEEFSRLVSLAKKYERKGGLTLEALCDELGVSPRVGREMAEAAIEAGYHVDVHGDVLGFREPEPVAHREVVVDTPPIALGDEIRIGVVSDTHFGSKHHERDALSRHIEWLYENGVRTIIHPGDLVAGGYRFLKYEVTHVGIEAQSELVADYVQSLGTEFTWHAIAGNHDESFDVGIDAAKMVEQMLRARGLANFHYHGPRGARLRFGPTRIALHHPGGGLSYALSYKIQKYIDAMPLADRPHFLFTGHTHQKLWLERGGVNGFLCGTTENGDSGFGRMLGGEVQVGGWLVCYRHDEAGGVASVRAEFRHQPHARMRYVQVPA